MPEFEELLSDKVFMEGSWASTTSSMYCRFANLPEIIALRVAIENDAEKANRLAKFVEDLSLADHDPNYSIPNDMAICAGLMVLDANKTELVTALMKKFQETNQLSLGMVQLMANYCLITPQTKKDILLGKDKNELGE